MKKERASQIENPLLQVIASAVAQRRAPKEGSEGVAPFPGIPIRVYVLSFDPMRAVGLEAIFQETSGIEIVSEKITGQDGADQVGSGWLDPSVHIVVVGTHLGPGTQKLIATIRSARPSVPILVMSPAAGDEAILNVLDQGAKGFLHEGATAAQFEEAIRALAAGSIWAPRRLLSELITRLLSSRDPQNALAKTTFTARERQVLNLLLDGRSNREIARSLQIGERTVKSYVTKLLRKMSVSNRTALSMLAISAKDS